jgi:hypothetical protein
MSSKDKVAIVTGGNSGSTRSGCGIIAAGLHRAVTEKRWRSRFSSHGRRVGGTQPLRLQLAMNRGLSVSHLAGK